MAQDVGSEKAPGFEIARAAAFNLNGVNFGWDPRFILVDDAYGCEMGAVGRNGVAESRSRVQRLRDLVDVVCKVQCTEVAGWALFILFCCLSPSDCIVSWAHHLLFI